MEAGCRCHCEDCPVVKFTTAGGEVDTAHTCAHFAGDTHQQARSALTGPLMYLDAANYHEKTSLQLAIPS